MSKSIDLKFLDKVFRKAWWKILIFTVVVAIGVGVFTEFFIPKKYTSSVEFMVNNVSVTTEYTTSALTSATEYLINDYIKIISGDDMVKMIKEYISDPNRDTSGTYANITEVQIRSLISSQKYSENSSMFTIDITTASDKKLAFYIAECISINAPGIIKKISRPVYSSNIYKKVTAMDSNGKEIVAYEAVQGLDIECVTVICAPIVADSPSSSSTFTRMAVSALCAVVASYVFFVLLDLFRLYKNDSISVTETNTTASTDI